MARPGLYVSIAWKARYLIGSDNNGNLEHTIDIRWKKLRGKLGNPRANLDLVFATSASCGEVGIYVENRRVDTFSPRTPSNPRVRIMPGSFFHQPVAGSELQAQLRFVEHKCIADEGASCNYEFTCSLEGSGDVIKEATFAVVLPAPWKGRIARWIARRQSMPITGEKDVDRMKYEYQPNDDAVLVTWAGVPISYSQRPLSISYRARFGLGKPLAWIAERLIKAKLGIE